MVSGQKIMFSDLEPYRQSSVDWQRAKMLTEQVQKITIQSSTSSVLSAELGAGSATPSGPRSVGRVSYSTAQSRVLSRCFTGSRKVSSSVDLRRWDVKADSVASVGIVADMYEGFDNLSLMMGSTPRVRGKVTDWKSGFKEGGKAVSLGLWDGITGIVTEPVDGARREGFTGFGKGVGRGCERCFPSGNGCSADGTVANLINRPLAGYLGLFVLPTRGIRESVRSALGTHLDPHSVLRGPREALTRSAMTELSGEYKQRLLDTFAVLETETRARRRERNRTQWILMANKDEREKERIERHRRDAEKKERRDMLKRVKGDGGGRKGGTEG